MLPPEQIEQLRKQIISQLESSNIPNKEETKKNIELMNSKELEEFLIKNNLIKDPNNPSEQQKCIFCSIILNKINSYKIGENEKAIAILEINPISKGHTIIIPKDHLENNENVLSKAQELIKEISKKIKEKLNPKDIKISTSSLFGHEIINLLPIYTNETIESEKKQAKPEELLKLQDILKLPKKEKIETTENKIEQIDVDKIWLPKRIP